MPVRHEIESVEWDAEGGWFSCACGYHYEGEGYRGAIEDHLAGVTNQRPQATAGGQVTDLLQTLADLGQAGLETLLKAGNQAGSQTTGRVGEESTPFGVSLEEPPLGSVLLDADGDAWQRRNWPEMLGDRWYCASGIGADWKQLTRDNRPFKVLYVPVGPTSPRKEDTHTTPSPSLSDLLTTAAAGAAGAAGRIMQAGGATKAKAEDADTVTKLLDAAKALNALRGIL